MRKNKSEQGGTSVPRADAVAAPAPDRLVDGVPVRTYRGQSLASLAPQIRAELGDNAMILRQREGVTGGIAGFFAKRMVEIDVAVIGAPRAPHIDTTDGPSIGPGRLLPEPNVAPQATGTFEALGQPSPLPSRELVPPVPAVGHLFPSPEANGSQPTQPFTPPDLADPQAAPALQPTVPFSAIAEQHGLDEARSRAAGAAADAEASGPTDYGMFAEGLGAPAVPPGVPLTQPNSPQAKPFSIGMPSAAEAAGVEAQLAAHRAPASESQIGDEPAHAAPPAPPQPAAQAPAAPRASEPAAAAPPAAPEPPAAPLSPPTSADAFDSPFDPGRGGAEAAPVAQSQSSFEDRVRDAGLAGATDADPVAQLGALHGQLLRRGLPDQIASPVVDDTLLHRVALQPGRPVSELLSSELARRIPTAPLAGRAGQAVAFVGSSGAGKTRAIARLAAAYGAAARVPVACVTLQDSGHDGLLATSLAPFGIAVHAAPDAPRALDRITALRRSCLVLVDTPGVSPGDTSAVDDLGATLGLLELDQVALCLPVVLAAPIARRVLRAMRPLGPTLLVATHADEADLLGGVVAVAIDRRVPLAYVSAGAGRGGIVGADAHHIATEMLSGERQLAERPSRPSASRAAGRRAITPIDRAAQRSEPTVPEPVRSEPEPALHTERPGPSIDVAAGAAHLAVPWIMSSPRRPGRRGQ